jgi:hypothetical protein
MTFWFIAIKTRYLFLFLFGYKVMALVEQHPDDWGFIV